MQLRRKQYLEPYNINKLKVTKYLVLSKLNLIIFITLFFVSLNSFGKNPLKVIYQDVPIKKSYEKWEEFLSNNVEFIQIHNDSLSKKYKVKNIDSYGVDVDSVIIIISKFHNSKTIEQIIYYSNINQLGNQFSIFKNLIDKSFRHLGMYHYSGISYTWVEFGYCYKTHFIRKYPQFCIGKCLDKSIGLSIHFKYKIRNRNFYD